MRAERMSELNAHMAKSTQTYNSDFLAGSDLPAAQGRIGGDARTKQRRNGDKLKSVGNL